jgi:hypothetical protein
MAILTALISDSMCCGAPTDFDPPFDAGGGVCPPLCGAGFGQGWPLAGVAGRDAEQGAFGRNDRPCRAYFTVFATGLGEC